MNIILRTFSHKKIYFQIDFGKYFSKEEGKHDFNEILSRKQLERKAIILIFPGVTGTKNSNYVKYL